MSLDALMSRALALALPDGAADPDVRAEARRVAVFALGFAAAERSGRVGLGDAPPAGWFLGAPPVDAGARAMRVRVGLGVQLSAERLLGAPEHSWIAAYERSLGGIAEGPASRRGRGAFYTPPALVEGLLDDALDPVLAASDPPDRLRVCDPSCGAGAFLLAAHRRLVAAMVRSGWGLAEASARVARDGLVGVDLDRAAVELARFLLWMRTELPFGELSSVRGLRVGDALLDPPSELGLTGGFDVVVGNPPFLGQLRSASARDASARARLAARFGGRVGGYADAAAAFVLLGLEQTRPGGRCGMVLPASFLASRDALPARRSAAEQGSLTALWTSPDRVFANASVYVVAATFARGGPRRAAVRRRRALSFSEAPSREVDMDALAVRPTWSPLVSDLLGIPSVALPEGDPVLGSIATVTADFRDQFYGLRGSVLEDAELPSGADRSAFPALVTTGLVDAGDCRWGRVPTRFDGRRWAAPRVDLSRLDDRIAAWARARLVPKVLVASQTRALEAVVDARGAWLPCTPLISVIPHDAEDLWRLAAALTSPPLTAYAASTWLGSALSLSAIKLTAGQIRGLPLPPDRAAWSRAAAAFRSAQGGGDRLTALRRCGALMCVAYGLDPTASDGLLGWWSRAAGLES